MPKFQRSYAWTSENVGDLLNDISTYVESNQNEYFLGPIVITAAEKKLNVVDGQQRLATIYILVSAIRNYLNDNHQQERALEIQRDFLAKKDLSTMEEQSQLNLNDNDNHFFFKRILKREPVIPDKESHKKILETLNKCTEFINSQVRTSNDPIKKILSILSFIEENLKIIIVTAPSDTNAYLIFETLNDRGLSLAISDLLKNYLYFQAGDRQDEIERSWIAMSSILEAAVGGEEILATFIRHFWSSKYGATRETKLYDNIKRQINTKDRTVTFGNELENNAKYYAAILNSDHYFWAKLDTSSRDYLKVLNFLRMIQMRPLILTIMSEFVENEISISLKYLVTTAVRFLIVGGLGGGSLEERYCNIAVKIRNHKISNSRQLLNELTKIVPNDKVFRESFSTVTTSKTNFARYYLRSLEKANKNESEPELIPNDNEAEINLEHIIPQSPSDHWDLSAEELSLLTNRLGNLVLMKRSKNSSIGNAGFSEKKKSFTQSTFELTRGIAKNTKWTKKEIDKRQKEMADLALKVWALN
ncbi:DUF262 domain-containing protein [Candidatus Woesebacteria bacterium]|nr:DUF262 domain-containing protein [Candidatus Woesebacteria bacterium]